MAQLIIDGGVPLKGKVCLKGAKNSSFKLMIAALLNTNKVKLTNLCQISDVDLVKKIIVSLGGRIQTHQDSITINALNLNSSFISRELGLASRASSLFIAPLLARFKKAIVPFPGGDKIGQRPLERHFAGLRALGATIEFKQNLIYAYCPQLTGATYEFPKISHTGTETMIMAGTLAKGKTTIRNAALEPEVDDLINCLNLMGAKIQRLPGRVIEIDGVARLKPVTYKIMPDRNEAVSYAIAALITKGEVIVANARSQDIAAFLAKLTAVGGGYEINLNQIRFFYHQPLKAINIITAPHPGFMTDWQPLWSVLATQCQGESQVLETIFTSRFQFVKDLQQMGAKITVFNPAVKNPDEFYNFNLQDDRPESFHAIKVTGITPLSGRTMSITDIRAGATLTLAGLAAQGITTLTNIEPIDRGYENFSGRLQKLGAKIKRID